MSGLDRSHFLSSFVIEMVTDIPLTIDICSDKVSSLEYASDVVYRSEYPNKLQDILDRLSVSKSIYEMCFAPSKCKMLIKGWIGSEPSLVLAQEQVSEVRWIWLPRQSYLVWLSYIG